MIQKDYKPAKQLTTAELRRDVKRGIAGMKWGWGILMLGIFAFLLCTFLLPVELMPLQYGGVAVVLVGFSVMFAGQHKAISGVREQTRRENAAKGIYDDD